MPRMMMTTRSSISVKPCSSRARRCLSEAIILGYSLSGNGMRCGIAVASALSGAAPRRLMPRTGDEPANDEGRGLPRPSSSRSRRLGLAAAAGGEAGVLDVAGGADLVVGRGARRGVLDAVGRRVGADDLDVLDPLVVGGLEDRERDALVAGGVVGVERLHAGDGGADVRLGGGDVRSRPEAEVGRDGDREQDAEDDDDDEELDQREALLVAGQAVPERSDHSGSLLERERNAVRYCGGFGSIGSRSTPIDASDG